MGLGKSLWHNPYKVPPHSVEEAIRLFKKRVLKDWSLWNALPQLEGRHLLCHCPKGSPCHADALMELFQEHTEWHKKYALPRPLSASVGGCAEGWFQDVVIIELFGGIMPASLAAEVLRLQVAAHYTSEPNPDALAVAYGRFPELRRLADVEHIDRETLICITTEFPKSLILFTAGPPCQDVSYLNEDGEGAWGQESGKREYAKNCFDILKEVAGDRLRGILECTCMRPEDREPYDNFFGDAPYLLCASEFAPITRPRLWWIFGEQRWPQEAQCNKQEDGSYKVSANAKRISVSDCLVPG